MRISTTQIEWLGKTVLATSWTVVMTVVITLPFGKTI